MSGGEYWLRWQVPVCALIIIIPSAVAANLIKKGQQKDTHLKPTHLWVPCWRNLHPRWLLLYRVLALLTMVYLLYMTVATFGIFVFFFYTQWTFALVIVYLIFATIISARGCWFYSGKPEARDSERDELIKKSKKSKEKPNSNIIEDAEERQEGYPNRGPNEKSIGFLEASMQIVYQICAGAVMLTDLVFWFILVPFTMSDDFKLTMLIGLMHSVNVVFLFLDSTFNSLPFTWYGLTYFVLWSCIYVIFQWVLHACCISWWPYPFLELATPWAPLWYLALALVHIACYGLYMVLVTAKNSLFSRLFPRTFNRVAMEKKHV